MLIYAVTCKSRIGTKFDNIYMKRRILDKAAKTAITYFYFMNHLSHKTQKKVVEIFMPEII